MTNKSTKSNIEGRLGIIETDIKYLTKSFDRLINALPDLSEINVRVGSLEKKVLALEIKSTKKDLLVWSALISAIIVLALKDVFL